MTSGSTKILGYGALAIATAVIASGCERTATIGRAPGVSVLDSTQGESPVEDRIWVGCDLRDDTVRGLIDDMRDSDDLGALGTPTVAYVKVLTFRNNGGQPLGADTAPEGPHTGPVYCRNPDQTKPPIPVQQTDNIGGNGSTLDLLDLDNTGLRYRLNGGVEKRDCHAAGDVSQCALFIPEP
jgi:hypothetical protein